ncbi:MAG: cell wall-binding repeat-containing protein [Euzebya sp.]
MRTTARIPTAPTPTAPTPTTPTPTPVTGLVLALALVLATVVSPSGPATADVAPPYQPVISVPDTADAIRDLDPDNLIVIGGTTAVSDATAQTLADGRPVQRIAGPERFTTAAQVATTIHPDTARAVLLIDGTDPDAWTTGFAAAHPAATQDIAILLTDGQDLPDVTRTALANLQPEHLYCTSSSATCTAARMAAGMPDVADVTISPTPGTPVAAGQPLTITAPDGAQVTIIDDGDCLTDGVRTGDPSAECLVKAHVDATGPGDGTETAGQTLYISWPAIVLGDGPLAGPPEYTSPAGARHARLGVSPGLQLRFDPNEDIAAGRRWSVTSVQLHEAQ